MLTVAAPAQQFLDATLKKLAVIWDIERTDGTTLYFTTHDTPIVYSGNTYEPGGGADASARRSVDALRDSSVEFRGGISSDLITQDDLRAGLYKNAKIIERIVNWQFPFNGPIITKVYWLDNATFDDEVWIADCTGPERFTKRTFNAVFSRNCQKKLGSPLCGVTLASFTSTGAIVLGCEDGQKKKIIRATTASIGAFTDGVFDYGTVTFTSGANSGLSRVVKSYTADSRRFEMQVAFPYPIAAGDVFTAVQGCDLLSTTCDTKFSNLDNYGGFFLMPGTDRILTTPNSR